MKKKKTKIRQFFSFSTEKEEEGKERKISREFMIFENFGRHHHLQIKCQMRQGNMKRKERKNQ